MISGVRRSIGPIVILCAGCSAVPADNTSRSADRLFSSAAAPVKASSSHTGGSLPQAGLRQDIAEPVSERNAKTLAADAIPDRAPIADTRPRMGSILEGSSIYKKPAREGLALGYIRLGTSVPLLSDRPVPGSGCARGWYAVAPRGYACLDRTTTLDIQDPYFRALASVAPPPDAVWPYRYAFSNGAPMYGRIPTPEEQEKAERGFGPRRSFVQLAEWSKGHEELITTEPIVATDPVPDFFAGGKRHVSSGVYSPKMLVWRTIPNGSMLSYAKAFEAEGRVWLLTPDLMLVPADRVRAMRRSTFRGVRLSDGPELPLAWNRAFSPRPKLRREPDGTMVEAGSIGGKSSVPVTGERIVEGKKAYLAVRGQPNMYVAESDVTITRPRTTLPRGVSAADKWIEVKIVQGTLTAYEGLKPLYATLFSPGKGGAPVPGYDPYIHSMTRTGFFPIEWKDRVATMSPDKGPPTMLWISDVPHIQYLDPPLAMHVSFWHEDFGKPKSAECVNVSPEDGYWLFHWTDPPLPEGWGGIRPGDGNGKSTPVVISAL